MFSFIDIDISKEYLTKKIKTVAFLYWFLITCINNLTNYFVIAKIYELSRIIYFLNDNIVKYIKKRFLKK